MKNELKGFKRVLSPDDPKCSEKKREDENVIDDQIRRKSTGGAAEKLF